MDKKDIIIRDLKSIYKELTKVSADIFSLPNTYLNSKTSVNDSLNSIKQTIEMFKFEIDLYEDKKSESLGHIDNDLSAKEVAQLIRERIGYNNRQVGIRSHTGVVNITIYDGKVHKDIIEKVAYNPDLNPHKNLIINIRTNIIR